MGIKITFALLTLAAIFVFTKGRIDYNTNTTELYNTNIQCGSECATRCGEEARANNKQLRLWSCSPNLINKFNCICTFVDVKS